jgi:hypothetical protein
MDTIGIICATVITISILIKALFWQRIPNKRFPTLLRSYRRYYNQVDIHDSETGQSRIFKSASNICNIIGGIALATILIMLYLELTSLPKTI